MIFWKIKIKPYILRKLNYVVFIFYICRFKLALYILSDIWHPKLKYDVKLFKETIITLIIACHFHVCEVVSTIDINSLFS